MATIAAPWSISPMEYLQNNPLVLLAALLAAVTVATMTVASVIHLRFLRELRAEAQPFWVEHFGGGGVGLVRMLDVTPARVSAVATDEVIRKLCRAYAGRFLFWRVASLVLFGTTVAALIATGLLNM